jgi:hypothetical protein
MGAARSEEVPTQWFERSKIATVLSDCDVIVIDPRSPTWSADGFSLTVTNEANGWKVLRPFFATSSPNLASWRGRVTRPTQTKRSSRYAADAHTTLVKPHGGCVCRTMGKIAFEDPETDHAALCPHFSRFFLAHVFRNSHEYNAN